MFLIFWVKKKKKKKNTLYENIQATWINSSWKQYRCLSKHRRKIFYTACLSQDINYTRLQLFSFKKIERIPTLLNAWNNVSN